MSLFESPTINHLNHTLQRSMLNEEEEAAHTHQRLDDYDHRQANFDKTRAVEPRDEVDNVIEGLRTFFALLSLSRVDMYDRELTKAFQQVHCPDTVTIEDGKITKRYGDIYRDYLKIASMDYKLEVIEYQKISKRQAKILICGQSKKVTTKLWLRVTATIGNGKFLVIENASRSRKAAVPGQVQAKKKAAELEYLSEWELSSSVRSLPGDLNKHLLGKRCGMVPAERKHQVIKMRLDRQPRVSSPQFYFRDTLSIKDSKGEKFAGGVHFRRQKKFLGCSTYTLCDEEKSPLAAIVAERTRLSKAFVIYGIEPLRQGDEPAFQNEGVNFYRWFQVSDIDSRTPHYRPVGVWNGEDYDRLLRVYTGNQACRDNSPTFLRPNPCVMLIVKEHGEQELGYSVLKNNGWNMTVAPGVDPAMMVCLTLSVDRMISCFD